MEEIFYKIVFKDKDRSNLIISEDLASSILENMGRANVGAFDELIWGYSDDKMLILSKRDILYITYSHRIMVKEKD